MPFRVSLRGTSDTTFIKCLTPGAGLNDWDIVSDLQSRGCSAHYSVQFTSVAQSCLTLCDPMNCSTSGLPVHHSDSRPSSP